MSKPPKVVIPGLDRGAGISAGKIVGRSRRAGKGPAQLLDQAEMRALGYATIAGVTQADDALRKELENKIRSFNPSMVVGDAGEDGAMGPPGPAGAAGAAGATGATGAAGAAGRPGIDGADGDDGAMGPPGQPGAAGATGSAGATGPQGPIGFAIDGLDGEEGMPIPGVPGVAGAAGAAGATGPQGPIGFGMDGQDGDDGQAIPGTPGPAGAVGGGGLAVGAFDTLNTAFADSGNSTTVETDIFTYTTPAGQLATNGDRFEMEASGTFVSSGTATRQLRAYFGGTMIFDTGALTVSLSAAWDLFCTITRVSSTVIRYAVTMTTEGAALAAYTASGAVTGLTLSNTNIIKVTGTAAGVGAATNDIICKMGAVDFKPSTPDVISSSVQGDILYRNATVWTRLPAGTSGQFLQTKGASANPVWAAAEWTQISHTAISSPTASITFSGTDNYTELMFIADGVTQSASDFLTLVASVDGSTFYTASGDYAAIAVDGTLSNRVELVGQSAASALARYLFVRILHNVSGVPKDIIGMSDTRRFRASNSPIKALKFAPFTGTTNLTGGDVYLLGR